MSPPRVLVVANRTAADLPLLRAVEERAREGEAVFHLLIPAEPEGLHRVVDPEVAGREAAGARLSHALPLLSEAAAQEVTGQVGDADPLAAVCDALHQGGFDEIIISTLPWRVSRWLRVDLPSKLRALGVPVRHIESSEAMTRERPEAAAHARPDTVMHARAETGGAAVVPTGRA
jgi:hypothetical protein